LSSHIFSYLDLPRLKCLRRVYPQKVMPFALPVCPSEYIIVRFCCERILKCGDIIMCASLFCLTGGSE
jgi:hypothetical protein